MLKCVYEVDGVPCGEKRLSHSAMDEHKQVAHGGERTVGGAQPVPAAGEPSNVLRGLEEQMRNAVEQRTQMPIEEAAKAVERGEIEAPMLNVREQHLNLAGTPLPSKVRCYDERGYQRLVPPEIAVDRVLFKGWRWPNPGEPEGHAKNEKWYTWGPCHICGRSDETDDARGADEALLQHQRIDHPDWWKVHQADQERQTQRIMAESLRELVRQGKAGGNDA